MAKFWEPGSVKTRLGRDIGMRAAAAIHREFFGFLARSLSCDDPGSSSALENPGDSCWPQLEAVIAPPSRLEAFESELAERLDELPGRNGRVDGQCEPKGRLKPAHQRIAERNWRVVGQCDGDLGERMRAWFRRVLNAPADGKNGPEQDLAQATRRRLAVLVGCDCPLLSASDLTVSFELLRHHDVVLGPALDGGYYLIGLAGPYHSEHDALFTEMAWSTEAVLETTLARINSAGLSLAMLTPKRDVDELDDLEFLRQELAASSEPRAQALGLRLSELLQDSGEIIEEGRRYQDGS